MAGLGHLTAASLIEKDVDSDVLWTWSYPSVTQTFRQLILRKCCLKTDKDEIVPFCFGQFDRQWFYIYTSEVKNSDALSKVGHLCGIDTDSEGDASSMLELYLSVITKGSCSNGVDESLVVEDFDPRMSYVTSPISDVINIFGVETILIYTALLLKKKVVVYSPKIDTLLEISRALPQLVWHRQNWSILYPYVHLEDEELEKLSSCVTYIAGFTDASVESKTELYDLFVNETFQMGKIHKEIAMFMVEAAKNEEYDDQRLVKELSNQTKDLINNLKKLAVKPEEGGKARITIETLKQRKLSAVVENFLFNLATAEGLV
ncbi:DENN domain-containing protein 10 [Acropora cervicornis]|uniref:DENN domain-containing protein 10 n=1 Tax=Acropora cervicornis TaxID=6130 RepID=A0AAD9R3W7_ACRCE|nr:DENN domain-containing protein 10 [Acropora cervicornis]